MSQKWTNNNNENVFREYKVISDVSIQTQDTSPPDNSLLGADSGHMLPTQQIMIPTENSYSSAKIHTQEPCTRNECKISKDNEEIHIPVMELDNQSSGHKDELFEDEEEPCQDPATCFVCCSLLKDKSPFLVKGSMKHSHAPLLVLLIDVLGYKLESANLHTQFVCQSCYHLLDIIDELQQTLTESKTDLRTRFLETVQRLKLKYPRTDKMLKPRCLRCIQVTQATSKKKNKGNRGSVKSKGNDEDKKVTNKSGNFMLGEEEQNEVGNESKGVDEPMPMEDFNLCVAPENTHRSSEMMTADIVYDSDPVFFSPDEKLKAGIVKEADDGTPVYLCMHCTARYDSTLPLKMHVRVFHMPVLVYDNGQGTPETRSRIGIKLHNTNPNEFCSAVKPFVCLFCSSAYKQQGSLQFHFRENHSPLKPFQCSDCNESFRRTIELSRHRVYRCPMKSGQKTAQPKR